MIADVLALYFGRADKWWSWATTVVLIAGILVVYYGPLLVDFVIAMAIFAVVSSIGVWWRRRGMKND